MFIDWNIQLSKYVNLLKLSNRSAVVPIKTLIVDTAELGKELNKKVWVELEYVESVISRDIGKLLEPYGNRQRRLCRWSSFSLLQWWN